MKTSFRLIIAVLGLTGALTLLGQTVSQPSKAIHYQLLEGSTFTDDTLTGDRVVFPRPMSGSFDLVPNGANPLYQQFIITNAVFTVGAEPLFLFNGTGTYQFGGEVATRQEITLRMAWDTQMLDFTNESQVVSIPDPMIHIDLIQSPAPPDRFFRFSIKAAPFREIWFSTVNGFHSANDPSLSRMMGGEDLLSSANRVVKTQADLLAQLHIPTLPDGPLISMMTIGLKGDLLIALAQNVKSDTLGLLAQGNVYSTSGRLYINNTDLVGPLGAMPPTPNLGLLAAQVLDDGEILFAVKDSVFSEKLNRTIGPGEIYSSRGYVFRSKAELMARYPKAASNAGLDAFYVWPNQREIWFSIVNGYVDDQLGSVQQGDILSEQGYRVFRNLDLLRPFSPLEDLADFGLDSLYVVTDSITPSTPVPTLDLFQIQNPTSLPDITLHWKANGRLFQVEKATTLTGPYQGTSPIQVETSYIDFQAIQKSLQGYYRLRQWQ